MKTMARSY